ncbi:MAG: type II secretion system protein GspM [Thermodesulfobacteriota bacterium]|nr:type II secretion system protein GspM [Thermodesulfobacteriota bacterium]
MRLNRRESVFIGIGILVLVILGFYFLLVEPLAARRDKLEQLSARLEGDLAEVQSLAAQYKAVASQKARLQDRVQARGQDYSPFSHLENMAREAGLTGRIESMTPVAASAEEGRDLPAEFDIRLSGVGLMELVHFLYRLEAGDKVFFVISLNIRPRYLSPDILDVTLRLATPAVV